jgi:hypothetical protein
MKCRNAERLMVRAKDSVLAASEKDSLDGHLRQCSRCRRVSGEYRDLFQALLPVESPQPGAYSWVRLKARIEEREAAAVKPLYEKWALKVIPAAVALALLIGSASLLFRASQSLQASSTEELLLSNTNPLVEAQTILEQKRFEDKGMMLIFASNEVGALERR